MELRSRENIPQIEAITTKNEEATASNYSDLCDLKTLKDTLKPLFISLRIFGSTYGDVFRASHSKSNTVGYSDDGFDIKPGFREKGYCSRKWSHIFGVIYSMFVFLASLAVVVHGLFEISTKQELLHLMGRVFFCLWVLLCLFQHVLCVYLTSFRWKNKKNRFDKFVDAMLLVRAESAEKSRCHVLKNLQIGWLYIISNLLVLYAANFYPDKETREIVRQILLGRSEWSVANHDELAYGYTGIIIILAGTWSIPTCFYTSLCIMLTGCFDDLYERASRDVKMKTINLEELRDEFVRLCNALSALNDLLSPLGMLMFSIYVPAICLNINVCLQTFRQDVVISRVAYILWIVLNSSILLTVSIYGSNVNESASRLSEVMHNVKTKDLDMKSELELMLLISNLNTNYACLTVGGVVTLTKEMILTLFGTIVGYLTVIVQFK